MSREGELQEAFDSDGRETLPIQKAFFSGINDRDVFARLTARARKRYESGYETTIDQSIPKRRKSNDKTGAGDRTRVFLTLITLTNRSHGNLWMNTDRSILNQGCRNLIKRRSTPFEDGKATQVHHVRDGVALCTDQDNPSPAATPDELANAIHQK